MTVSDLIIDFIVASGYCSGCGTCAGVCPKNVFEMVYDNAGCIVPVVVNNNCNNCSLCISVCPGGNTGNEKHVAEQLFNDCPDIKYHIDTGYYLSAYGGHVKDREKRWNSASGGVTTWLLKKMLSRGDVDCVVSVRSTGAAFPMYEYCIVSQPEYLDKCSKSVYYPVEMSKAIKNILLSSSKFAVVGLPCFIRAIQNIRSIMPAFRRKVIYTVSLVCGQQKSIQYTDCIAQGVFEKKNIKTVVFREKNNNRPASVFDHKIEYINGENDLISWDNGPSDIWTSDIFKLSACNYCTDIFGECADVVLMDAWLDDYIHESEGNNLFITRSHFIERIISDNIDEIDLIPETIERVIESQAGVVRNKRNRYKKQLINKKNSNLQSLDIKYKKCNLNYFDEHDYMKSIGFWDLCILKTKKYLSDNSSGLWIDSDFDSLKFRSKLALYLNLLKFFYKADSLTKKVWK